MGCRHPSRTLEIRLNPPRPLLSAWPELGERLRTARRRILLTDFDGTLVRIRRNYQQVRLSKQMRRLLARIAACGTVVAIVSGRSLADLQARVRLPGLWYVGSHGYRLRNPRGRVLSLATTAECARIRRAAQWIKPRLAALPGVYLDAKRASLAVHYRAARPRAAETIVRQLLGKLRGLRLLPGRKVWEVLPGGRVSKWTAVHCLLEREARGERGKIFLAYLGDDTTDESVFRNMKGITVVVGRRTGSAARYFLRSPGEVGEFLREWLSASQ